MLRVCVGARAWCAVRCVMYHTACHGATTLQRVTQQHQEKLALLPRLFSRPQNQQPVPQQSSGSADEVICRDSAKAQQPQRSVDSVIYPTLDATVMDRSGVEEFVFGEGALGLKLAPNPFFMCACSVKLVKRVVHGSSPCALALPFQRQRRQAQRQWLQCDY